MCQNVGTMKDDQFQASCVKTLTALCENVVDPVLVVCENVDARKVEHFQGIPPRSTRTVLRPLRYWTCRASSRSVAAASIRKSDWKRDFTGFTTRNSLRGWEETSFSHPAQDGWKSRIQLAGEVEGAAGGERPVGEAVRADELSALARSPRLRRGGDRRATWENIARGVNPFVVRSGLRKEPQTT